jgi:hypothetical protein
MAISGHRAVATFHRYQIADVASLRRAIETAASSNERPTSSKSRSSRPARERTQKANSRAKMQRG